MNTREERKIIITMSPDELRKLADKMETRWANLKTGDSTFVDFLHHESDFTINLHLDQHWFHKQPKTQPPIEDKIIEALLNVIRGTRDSLAYSLAHGYATDKKHLISGLDKVIEAYT